MQDDVITELRLEKRGGAITFNNEETLWLSRAILSERELALGQSLDLAEFKQWLLPRQYPEVLNAAVALLALRSRSSGELRKKLGQKRYLDEAVEMALYKLEKERLLDDGAFARQWASACARKGMGKGRILSELWQKGIDGELARQAVDELDDDQTGDAAVQIASKLLRRYQREEDPKKGMQKLMAAMARRGYAYGEASAAAEKAIRLAQQEEDV